MIEVAMIGTTCQSDKLKAWQAIMAIPASAIRRTTKDVGLMTAAEAVMSAADMSQLATIVTSLD